MTALKHAYQRGLLNALQRFKLSDVKSPQMPNTEAPNFKGPSGPEQLAKVFNPNEQMEMKQQPNKVAEALCTTCRQPKHYGACKKPERTRPDGIPHGKQADFNLGIKGNDPRFVGACENGPSTSPGYHAATSDSSLARARDGRPPDEQAASGFADLFRHEGIQNPADEWVNASNALVKVQSWNLPGSEGHSLRENRGPTVNPYEERPTDLSPPVGWGDEDLQRIQRAFDQIDNPADSTCMEGGTGAQPSGEPAALG